MRSNAILSRDRRWVTHRRTRRYSYLEQESILMRMWWAALMLSFCYTASPANAESGSYSVEIEERGATRTLEIHYYAPRALHERTRVLLVIPGAGRNAWSYRDAWIDAAEQHNVLILSPHYSEEGYPEFWDYNLAGMISEVRMNDARNAIASYEFVTSSADWIFDDFDLIFEDAKQRFDLTATTYDMFGHSAGGQIIHRLALFWPQSRASRLVAANSGWYTLPLFDVSFPYGLKEAGLTPPALRRAFRSRLILLLGEQDDENETRGHLARNEELDKQGVSRIARGRYFFSRAQQAAATLDTELNWRLDVVPDVGHDYARMSEAAARLLYASSL